MKNTKCYGKVQEDGVGTSEVLVTFRISVSTAGRQTARLEEGISGDRRDGELFQDTCQLTGERQGCRSRKGHTSYPAAF